MMIFHSYVSLPEGMFPDVPRDNPWQSPGRCEKIRLALHVPSLELQAWRVSCPSGNRSHPCKRKGGRATRTARSQNGRGSPRKRQRQRFPAGETNHSLRFFARSMFIPYWFDHQVLYDVILSDLIRHVIVYQFFWFPGQFLVGLWIFVGCGYWF